MRHLPRLGGDLRGLAGDELQRAQWPDDIATEFLSHFGLLIASRNAMRRSKPCTPRREHLGPPLYCRAKNNIQVPAPTRTEPNKRAIQRPKAVRPECPSMSGA
jgi:hypothetical protein